MTKLPLVVPPHVDETTASFVSRLALRNGTRAEGLCKDFGLAFRKVVDGDPDALGKLADLGGADPQILSANAFVRTTTQRWMWRGHDLHRNVLRGQRAALCPACARADIAAWPDLPPGAAVYGRIAWRIGPIHTCFVHRIPLAPIGGGREHLHDFAYHAAAVVPRLAELAAAGPQDPTAFEVYVEERLDGRYASPLLDPMPLDQVVRLVETAGAVIQWGPGVSLNDLSVSSRRLAGAKGFEAISSGPEAFEDLLKRLQNAMARRRQDGPGAVFGPLHTLLHSTREQAEYETVRSVARAFVAGNFVAGPDRITGERRLHSIHTLAKQSGVHPKRLRKHLRAAGVITEAQMADSDHNVRIDAENAETLAREVSGLLTRAEAMEHIGASRSQMDVMVASSLLTPRWELGAFGGYDGYAKADLDGFLDRLRAHSQPARKADKGFCAIPVAARRACCSAAEIIRLILDGKLVTRTLPGKPRYMGILVEAKAVRAAVVGQKPDGLSLRKAAREIGTSDRALEALIRLGHIQATTVISPVNRCPQTLVRNAEIAEFKATYVSLSVLAKERGVYVPTLRKRLDRADIRPAFDPAQIGVRFYLRGTPIART
jgi:hypothetical protein